MPRVTIPRGAYDVLVMQEGSSYIAYDRSGNTICRDSNTACIQEAVDSIGGSGVIFITRGRYKISRGINIPAGIALIGVSPHYPYVATDIPYSVVIEYTGNNADEKIINVYPRYQYTEQNVVVLKNLAITSSNWYGQALYMNCAKPILTWCTPHIAIRIENVGAGMYLNRVSGAYIDVVHHGARYGYDLNNFGIGDLVALSVIQDLAEDSYVHRIQIGGPFLTKLNRNIAGLYIINSLQRNVINYLSAYNLKHPNFPTYRMIGLYLEYIQNTQINMIAVNDYTDESYVDKPLVGSFFNTNINFLSLVNGREEFYIRGNVINISSMYVGCSDSFIKTYGKCVTGVIDRNASSNVSVKMLASINTDPSSDLVYWADKIAKYNGPWFNALPPSYYSEIKKKNGGTFTASGDGSTTRFTIPHGLYTTPSKVVVTPGTSLPSFYVTADATNIYVNFSSAPPSGTNIVLYWYAEV
jgi:hypothetical protein